MQLIILDDLLHFAVILFALSLVHAQYWNLIRYTAWDVFNGNLIGGVHNIYPGIVMVLCGVSGPLANLATMLDALIGLFVSGMFSPASGLLPGNKYGYIAMPHATFKVIADAPLAPFIEIEYPHIMALIFFSIYCVFDFVVVFHPILAKK